MPPSALNESPELHAARSLAANAARMLEHTPAFQQLDPGVQAAVRRDVATIDQALSNGEVRAAGSLPAPPAPLRQSGAAVRLPPPPPPVQRDAAGMASPGGAYAESLVLAGPRPAWRSALNGDETSSSGGSAPTDDQARAVDGEPGGRSRPATETLAGRVGALSDEVDFPAFVASLVHGTFDAIVDANIRQMEAFASLVSAVAKDVDEFTRDNVTSDQVRDFLVQQHPRDLALDLSGPAPRLQRRPQPEGDGDDPSGDAPPWLADYDLVGVSLDDDTVEELLVPAARRRVGENRMQMLATMVLLGMSRVNVRDGTIAARVRFRAAARDNAQVAYSQSDDPAGQTSWGARGSAAYDFHQTKISTVSANVQSDTQLNVELFGEVRINFVSETLPLERFVDPARLALLQRHARTADVGTPPAAPPPAPPAALPAVPATPPTPPIAAPVPATPGSGAPPAPPTP